MTRLVLALALVLACGDTESRAPEPIIARRVHELRPSDHHKLVQVRGTVVAIHAFTWSGERHVKFKLDDGDTRVSVLHKGAVPELLREGVEAKVLGRLVPSDEVRDALVAEGFEEVLRETTGDVFLSREIVVVAPDF